MDDLRKALGATLGNVWGAKYRNLPASDFMNRNLSLKVDEAVEI